MAENKERKAREFQEEVDDLNRKVEIMHDEIKKEQKLQEIEKIEQKTKFDLQQEDLASKRNQRMKDQREDDEAFSKMYSIQDFHENRKKEHQQLLQSRQERIAERQQHAFMHYAKKLSEITDDTEERNKKYNEEIERKLFYENLDNQNRLNEKKNQAKLFFFESEKEKQKRKIRESEEILKEREKHAMKLNDVHKEVAKKKEASAVAQKNLNQFWSKQKKELEAKRKGQIDDAKRRLSVTIKG